MSILSIIRDLLGCASGPSRLEQEQAYLKTKNEIEQRIENRPKILEGRIANYTAQLEKIQEDDNKTKQLEENPLNLEEIELITEGEPQGKSDLKIIPTSDVKRQAPLAPINTVNNKVQDKLTHIPTSDGKRQAPLPPINTVNNKRQAPRPPINVFVKAYKEAAENQTSKADQTASTLLG